MAYTSDSRGRRVAMTGTADARAGRLDLGRLLFGGVIAAIVAAVANLIVFFVARDGLDVAFVGDFGGNDVEELSPGLVAFMSAVPALLAAGFLWLLGRFLRRPLLVFQVIAGVVVLLSLGGPFTVEGASDGTKATMVAMHLIAGAISIGVLTVVARRQMGAAPA
jgi:hypothetical protein